jgi:N-succinyldiaminopimelate aminotransferase
MNPDLTRLHPYPFERLRALLAGIEPPRAMTPIAMTIGEPRHPAPRFVIEALEQSLEASLGRYPTSLGLPALREAIAAWLTRRFALPHGLVDPDTAVLPVNGTREALFAFAQAVIDRQRTAAPIVVMPNPFYQIYEGAALLAGAEPWYVPSDETTHFLPDIDAVPERVWARCQLLYLCSPGNPTGAVLDRTWLARALALAERFDFLIAADECYADLYLDEDTPPPSLLEAAVATGRSRFERCVVFHSLSKRSSVPGLRSGFVAGDPQVLARFLKYRTYHGCAVPTHVQQASIPAWRDDDHARANRALYREKFAGVLPVLAPVLDVYAPTAAFYLWPRVPGGDDERFARDLHATANVTVLPGSYLARDGSRGNPGRGRVRISLVAPVAQCVDAAHRIAEVAGRT